MRWTDESWTDDLTQAGSEWTSTDSPGQRSWEVEEGGLHPEMELNRL